MSNSVVPFWDTRYAEPGFLFGKAPNAFLQSQSHRLMPGQSVLAVADGEGRNGVWLAEQGLRVHAVEASSVALGKSRALAAQRGVSLEWEQVDLQTWDWPVAAVDVVAAIFIQFVGPEGRVKQFASIRQALKPGGLLILQGYTPRQLDFAALNFSTGGPPHAENMYTQAMLREAFGDWEILHLSEHDEIVEEGAGHSGQSALIDLVARKPG